jgi:2-keto-3-deoxy-L-arabinonate dehydratase
MVFHGIQPVLQLPFADRPEQGVVDAELVTLIERMIAAGVDGLVVPGLASEAWTLTERERDHVVALTAATISGRVRLIVGLDGVTVVAADRARRAAERGAAGLMVLPPPQAETPRAITEHFQRVADAGGVPLLMQDSPQVTGVRLDVPTIAATVESHPLVTSLKAEIPGSGPKTTAAHEAGVEIVAGWGGLGYLEQIERGAIGCMPGCDLGPALVEIDRSARSGDFEMATESYRRILPLLSFETASLSLLVLSAKRHFRRQGIFTRETMRDPARELDRLEAATVDALLNDLTAQRVPGFEASHASQGRRPE